MPKASGGGVRVSVVIPAYNAEDTIEECIRSAMSQGVDVEIIVADNYSTDGTAEKARRLGAKVLPRSGRPGNPASARNAGLSVAKGEYVLFLDSDEVLGEGVLKDCLRLANEMEIGMVKIPIVFVGSTFWSRCSAFWKNTHYKVCKKTTGNIPRFFPRRLLGEKPFNEKLPCKEDWELYERMRSKGVSEAYSKAKMYHLEPKTLKEMTIKNIKYSKSLTKLSKHIKNPYKTIIKQSFMTLIQAVKNPPTNPLTLIGCLILLIINIYLAVLARIQP